MNEEILKDAASSEVEFYTQNAAVIESISKDKLANFPYCISDSVYKLHKEPELSDWSCYLFGLGPRGLCFTPEKGKEPNAFWRLMQYICFGNEWFNRVEQKVYNGD